MASKITLEFTPAEVATLSLSIATALTYFAESPASPRDFVASAHCGELLLHILRQLTEDEKAEMLKFGAQMYE